MHCILQNCHLQDELDEAKWHIYPVFLTSHMYDCGCKQQQSEYACEKWQMLLLLCVCTSMYERIGKIPFQIKLPLCCVTLSNEGY